MAPKTVRRIRTKLKMTRDEFGALLCYEGNTVGKWECGTATPSPRAAAAIKALRDKR